MLSKNSKKLQKHIAMLKEGDAYKGWQVEELLKLNGELLKAKEDNEVEAKVEALGKELERVKDKLKQTQKELSKARPKVVKVEELKEKLTKPIRRLAA